MRKPLVAALLSLAAGIVCAAPPLPPDFTTDYILVRAGLTVAASTVSLSRNGNMAIYTSVARPTGMLAMLIKDEITERSTLDISGDELLMHEYAYIHRGSSKPRDMFVTWHDGVISGTYKGGELELMAAPDTLDPFSLQLRLMSDLAGNGDLFEYQVVDGRKIKEFRFARMGSETISVPAGRFDVIRVAKLQAPGEVAEITFWFAPALHFLPVRIEHVEEDGARSVLSLKTVEWR